MALTEATIAGAKTPAKMTKLLDGGGLQLWLMPAGTKLWRFCYRFDGAQRAMPLGNYPLVGLKAARTLRDHARGAIAAKRDPNPKISKATTAALMFNPDAVTFGEVAAEWREKQVADRRSKATLTKNDRLLAHALPYIKDKPVAEIEPRDVLNILRQVSNRGHYESAARLRMTVSSIMRFAVATDRAKSDPASALKGALARPKATPRAAITDPAKFGKLLAMIDGYVGQPQTMAALKLLPIFACRPGELRLAQWVEFDLKAKVWVIPAVRTKQRREHRVHLPESAVAILRNLRPFTEGSGLLFPAIGRNGRAMSENTINAALRSLGVGQAEHCGHGFRSSFSTIANESGKFRSDVIERHLAHDDKDSVRRTYNRSELWAERVALADWWAMECANLVTLHG